MVLEWSYGGHGLGGRGFWGGRGGWGGQGGRGWLG